MAFFNPRGDRPQSSARISGQPAPLDLAAKPKASMGMHIDRPKMQSPQAGIHYVMPHVAHSPNSFGAKK